MTTFETLIRTIPDYPKPGILFRDITTLLANADGFRQVVDALTEPYRGAGVTKVAGIEARGFILGGAVARGLSAGFAPLRKKGKLPHATHSVEYDLEYGKDCLEIHIDAVGEGERVLLIDDLIATGGTALAGAHLLRRCGAHILAAAFVIDLPDLGGADRLRAAGVEVSCLVSFPGD
jgi:adenine phosphoribosyltransferase